MTVILKKSYNFKIKKLENELIRISYETCYFENMQYFFYQIQNFTQTISMLFELQAVERSSLQRRDPVFDLFTLKNT